VRKGRPPEYRQRVKVALYIEAGELPTLQAAADRAGLTLSTWARTVLLEKAAAPAPCRARPRATKRRDRGTTRPGSETTRRVRED
jgi:hypothetical protein